MRVASSKLPVTAVRCRAAVSARWSRETAGPVAPTASTGRSWPASSVTQCLRRHVRVGVKPRDLIHAPAARRVARS